MKLKEKDNKEKKEKDHLEIFASAPIPKAVMTNTVPAMIAMLMVLVYNLADTFFVGQTHNALMVAAVSLATPVFLLFMALGTIFGIGGTSVISRALGEGRTEYSKKVCSFCMWGCVIVGIVFAVLIFAFMTPILKLIGASAKTMGYARQYLSIVTLAGPFVLISNCYANIIRTEGKAGTAMVGQLAGNLLNVILDPILILGLNWGVAGAAIATAVSNAAGAAFYLRYLTSGKSMLSIRPKDFTIHEGVLKNVLAIGIPASLGDILMSVSNIVANALVAGYGDMAVAGFGVAMKVTMITGMICIGFGQGVQPLLGFCIGAKNYPRFKKSLRFSVTFALGMSTVMTILCWIFTRNIVHAFLNNQSAFDYAVRFARILLTTSFLFGMYYVFLNALQAMGEAFSALIVNLSRQGIVYIPALFIMNALFGVSGLLWAQPVADILSSVLVISLYAAAMHRLSVKAEKDGVNSHKAEEVHA
ncbi:MAG: MATE family efflux transporter [Eubacterium sp.]